MLSTDLIWSQCNSILGSKYTHQKPKAELLPLNTELERILRNLKKVRFTEAVVMADQRETQQNIPVVEVD